MSFSAFNLRRRSLLRSTTLVLVSLLLAFRLARFPDVRPSLTLIIPVVLAGLGTSDTVRCLQLHWSFYHAAVVILLIMDVVALCMILFLFIYPYGHWLL